MKQTCSKRWRKFFLNSSRKLPNSTRRSNEDLNFFPKKGSQQQREHSKRQKLKEPQRSLTGTHSKALSSSHASPVTSPRRQTGWPSPTVRLAQPSRAGNIVHQRNDIPPPPKCKESPTSAGPIRAMMNLNINESHGLTWAMRRMSRKERQINASRQDISINFKKSISILPSFTVLYWPLLSLTDNSPVRLWRDPLNISLSSQRNSLKWSPKRMDR